MCVGGAGGRAEEQLVRRSPPAHSDLNCAAEESRLGMMRNSFPTRCKRLRARPPADATAIDSEHLPHSRSVGKGMKRERERGEVNGEEGVEGTEQNSPPRSQTGLGSGAERGEERRGGGKKSAAGIREMLNMI